MKYLKEVTIIFGITMLGEFLNYLLPFPVPSGVYGLFILLLLLCTGALHTEDVAEVGDFFLDTMPIMFIPQVWVCLTACRRRSPSWCR